MKQATVFIAQAVCCLLLCSCGQDNSPPVVDARKETYPVTGQVHVDGQPAHKVFVTCHNVNEIQKQNVFKSLGLTDENGKLDFSTYESSDGVPEGEYVLTFTWGEWDDYWKRFSGPDKLKDRYADPKKSEIRLTVKKGELADLGIIELSTR